MNAHQETGSRSFVSAGRVLNFEVMEKPVVSVKNGLLRMFAKVLPETIHTPP